MDEQNWDYTITVQPKRSRFSFSAQEIRELAISALVLSVAFTIARIGRNELFADPMLLILLLPISLISITAAFILHELSHKFMAQRYGAWSEYRMSMQGLVFALLTSFLGIVFAAPGAVMVGGYLTQEQNGKVSVAGPVMNLCLALLFFVIAIVVSFTGLTYVASLVIFASYINVFLAAFNMLPVGPLDGKKVWRWNKGVYAVVMGIALFSLLWMWGVV